IDKSVRERRVLARHDHRIRGSHESVDISASVDAAGRRAQKPWFDRLARMERNGMAAHAEGACAKRHVLADVPKADDAHRRAVEFVDSLARAEKSEAPLAFPQGGIGLLKALAQCDE